MRTHTERSARGRERVLGGEKKRMREIKWGYGAATWQLEREGKLGGNPKKGSGLGTKILSRSHSS